MKIKDGFILRQVAGNYIIMGVSDEAVDFNGMITINETGAFLWGILEQSTTEEELLGKLLSEYEVDEETAKKDIADFISKLQEGNLLEV